MLLKAKNKQSNRVATHPLLMNPKTLSCKFMLIWNAVIMCKLGSFSWVILRSSKIANLLRTKLKDWISFSPQRTCSSSSSSACGSCNYASARAPNCLWPSSGLLKPSSGLSSWSKCFATLWAGDIPTVLLNDLVSNGWKMTMAIASGFFTTPLSWTRYKYWSGSSSPQ